jgi:FlaA1/EpsC-like NDP-sugar epimerase
MEMNVPESVTNNILGTRNVVTACLEHDVERLVMISTDKAVRPTSVMGATKRIAEWIVLDAAQRSGKPYSVVRFGNVLGSRGSVVPLFEQQIASGGPVTVTDPEMERYFMTIPEAVHLVLQAATLDTDGRMYMLDMGEQIRIDDLAKDLIRLSGLEPGEDIEVVYTGLRPGDKLKEELHDPGEGYETTEHPDVMRVLERERLSGDELAQLVDSMAAMAQAGDSEGLLATLNRVVPGAQTKA